MVVVSVAVDCPRHTNRIRMQKYDNKVDGVIDLISIMFVIIKQRLSETTVAAVVGAWWERVRRRRSGALIRENNNQFEAEPPTSTQLRRWSLQQHSPLRTGWLIVTWAGGGGG